MTGLSRPTVSFAAIRPRSAGEEILQNGQKWVARMNVSKKKDGTTRKNLLHALSAWYFLNISERFCSLFQHGVRKMARQSRERADTRFARVKSPPMRSLSNSSSQANKIPVGVNA